MKNLILLLVVLVAHFPGGAVKKNYHYRPFGADAFTSTATSNVPVSSKTGSDYRGPFSGQSGSERCQRSSGCRWKSSSPAPSAAASSSRRLDLFADPSSARKGRRIVNGDYQASFTHRQSDKGNQRQPNDAPAVVPAAVTGNNDDTSAKSSAAVDASKANNGTSAVAPSPQEPEPEVGIGGLGGLVYDVNRLKRNLLQETLKAYKKELWTLLESPASTEEQIVQKLAALVQCSAVHTTTDSNLLDGTWTLAYTSRYGTTADLRKPVPVFPTSSGRNRRDGGDGSGNGKDGGPKIRRRRGGKEALLTTRQFEFHLEDLEDHEDAHTVQESRLFGGALVKRTKSQVSGLTRKTLSLKRESREWFLLGQRILRSSSGAAPDGEQEVRVVYLDVDLVVFAATVGAGEASSGGGSSSGNGSTTFLVYTKNPAWMDGRSRTKRKIRNLAGNFEYYVLRRRKRYQDQLYSSRLRRTPQEEVDRILQEIELHSKAGDSTASKLRVLKLGNLDPTASDEEGAWDGNVDPFVHLSADERQEMLKKMSVRQVENAGRVLEAKRERWFQRLNIFSSKRRSSRRRRKTYFKKPEDIR